MALVMEHMLAVSWYRGCCSTLLSTGATLPGTHATGRPHAFLAEDQAHWVLLSSGKASKAPAYGGC